MDQAVHYLKDVGCELHTMACPANPAHYILTYAVGTPTEPNEHHHQSLNNTTYAYSRVTLAQHSAPNATDPRET